MVIISPVLGNSDTWRQCLASFCLFLPSPCRKKYYSVVQIWWLYNIYLGQHPNLSVTALGLEPRVKILAGVIGPREGKTSVTVTDNSCINWLHTFFHFLSNLISLWSSVYKQAQNGNFLMLVRIKCVFSVKLIEHMGPCQWALSEQHHY